MVELDLWNKEICQVTKNFEEGYSCGFINNTFKLHKDINTDLDSTKFNNNIPKPYNTKCVLSISFCSTKSRLCKEYKGFKDFGVVCKYLSTSEGYKCILDGDNYICYESLVHYENLEVDIDKEDEENDNVKLIKLLMKIIF